MKPKRKGRLDPSWEEMADRWDIRAREAGALIPPGSRVLDLGCGAMTLRNFLPEGCSYVGCDFIRRDDKTIVCDFNAGQFPDDAASKSEVISILGVIEYLKDPDWFVASVASSKPKLVIVSFSFSQSRKNPARICYMSEREFIELFSKNGLSLTPHIGERTVYAGYDLNSITSTAPGPPAPPATPEVVSIEAAPPPPEP